MKDGRNYNISLLINLQNYRIDLVGISIEEDSDIIV